MTKRSVGNAQFDYVAGVDIAIKTLAIGERWIRIHQSRFDPLWFGPNVSEPPVGRFGAPGHEYGICYAGESFEFAFAEVFLQDASEMILDSKDIEARSASTLTLTKEIRLAELHGPGLKRLRIDSSFVQGPHAHCRELGLALWQHPAAVDGVRYSSCRNNDKYCIAVFDHAASALVLDSTENLIANAARLARTLDLYGVAMTT